MAKINDIDTKAAVSKFLQRQLLTPQSDNQANTADEVEALLETTALSFLLYPQAALPLVFKAKNTVRQLVQADLKALDFILEAMGDIRNPDIPINSTSDLVEAQAALVELDRLGRVGSEIPAFDRYKNSINRFLDRQLSSTLKRNRKREFERTGEEARQDIFSMLPQFNAAHSIVGERLDMLAGAITDFRSVDLRKIVSVTTLNRVRSSLRRVRDRATSGSISKTVIAIELLSGVASLESVSGFRDVYDPTVRTGALPANRSIEALSEPAKAYAETSEGPWVLGAGTWGIRGEVDPLGNGQEFDFEIPSTGASQSVYVYSELNVTTVDIPSGGTLYIHLEAAIPEDLEIPITDGPSISLATIIADINSALTSATCVENPSVPGIIIFGDSTISSITIRPDSSGSSGVYTDPSTNPSVHEILGFVAYQNSLPLGHFTANSLADSLKNRIPNSTVFVEGNRVVIESNETDPRLSSIRFDLGSGYVQNQFGLDGLYESLPSYIELVEDGESVDAEDLGVFIGSSVTAAEDEIGPSSAIRTLNNSPITDIQGSKLFFDVARIPRGLIGVTIISPHVRSSQELMQKASKLVGFFNGDISNIQRVMSPILSKPSSAQINDAIRELNRTREKLSEVIEILDSVVPRLDRSSFSDIIRKIVTSFEERGLDRALDLLLSAQFSKFFSLTKEDSSKSSRFMRAMEQAVTSDMPVSIIEQDIDEDFGIVGDNSDEDVLSPFELENEDKLVD
jgi:hypothetical protein